MTTFGTKGNINNLKISDFSNNSIVTQSDGDLTNFDNDTTVPTSASLINYVTRRVVNLSDTTAAPTAAQSGTIFIFDGTACTVTLPAAAAGLEYFFVFNATQSGDAVITTATDDKISGSLIKTIVGFQITVGSDTFAIDAIDPTTNTLTFDGTTKGGVIGSYINIIGLKANAWSVNGTVIGSGILITSAS